MNYRQYHRAANTARAYRAGWNRWKAWAGADAAAKKAATDGNAVAKFLEHMADSGLSVSTIRITLNAIAAKLKETDMPSPATLAVVRETMRGIARVKGNKQRRVRALLAKDVSRMIAACRDSVHGARSAAMLSVAFSCALRASEVCSLQVSDIANLDSSTPSIVIRGSKTDKDMSGQRVALLSDPKAINAIADIKRWMRMSGVSRGFLFQTLGAGGVPTGNPVHKSCMARLVKRQASMIGLDPEEYSSHSLRAGFVTEAAKNGARLDQIMAVTRHRNVETVLRYVRDRDRYSAHAGRGFL